MARLNWDALPRDYHMGVSNGVLYLQNFDGTYAPGVAWNGIRAITEIPTGGELSRLFADNMIYGGIRAQEGLSGRIEVYDYPSELSLCNGWKEPTFGLKVNLQHRKSFGLCYRSLINQYDYILHVIYAINLNPGEVTYKTIAEGADAVVHGWDFFTVPAKYRNMYPASSITFDSRKIGRDGMKVFEDVLYGTDTTPPTLPLFEDLVELGIVNEIRPYLVNAIDTVGLWVWDTFRFSDDSIPRAVHRESETRVYYNPPQSQVQKRPGIEYTIIHDEESPANPYPDRHHYSVTADTLPYDHASVREVIQEIQNTSLIRIRPSTDGYKFYDYSTYFKEDT